MPRVVSGLRKSGFAQQELIKMTNNASSESIAIYLQIDEKRHRLFIENMGRG